MVGARQRCSGGCCGGQRVGVMLVQVALACWLCAELGPAVEIKRPLETEYVTLTRLTFGQAKRAAGPLLSPRGKLRFIKAKRVLVISDYPERIEQIERAVRQLDAARLTIRLEVRLQPGVRPRQPATVTAGHDGVHGGDRASQGSPSSPTPDAAGVSVYRTTNATPVCVWRQPSVGDEDWLRAYGAARGRWERDATLQFESASLWVSPRLMSNGEIEVAVRPSVCVRGPASTTMIDLLGLALSVVARDGHAVTPGRVFPDTVRLYRRLFGDVRLFRDGELYLHVTPQVGRPPIPAEEEGQ